MLGHCRVHKLVILQHNNYEHHQQLMTMLQMKASHLARDANWNVSVGDWRQQLQRNFSCNHSRNIHSYHWQYTGTTVQYILTSTVEANSMITS